MPALIVLSALIGLLIGSFLNVVIYRVPRGESVNKPRSHCPGCNTEIAPRDNVPVLSWLVLRGRCRHCGEPISIRYPAVELLTALVFGSLAAKFGGSWALPAFLYLAAVGIALAFIDYDTKRLPNVLTLPSYLIAPLLLLIPSAVDGVWPDFVRALAGGAILYAFYFLLAFIYPAGMGFGDVKLSGVLGIYLAWLGWGTLVVGAFLGFLLGGLGGIALMVFTKAGRKTKIPYGPYMIVGAYVAIFVGQPISHWYTTILGL